MFWLQRHEYIQETTEGPRRRTQYRGGTHWYHDQEGCDETGGLTGARSRLMDQRFVSDRISTLVGISPGGGSRPASATGPIPCGCLSGWPRRWTCGPACACWISAVAAGHRPSSCTASSTCRSGPPIRAWWTQDQGWCLHSATWWRRHWEQSGIMDIEVADTMPDGWREVVGLAPGDRSQQPGGNPGAGNGPGQVPWLRPPGRPKAAETLSCGSAIVSAPVEYKKTPLLNVPV